MTGSGTGTATVLGLAILGLAANARRTADAALADGGASQLGRPNSIPANRPAKATRGVSTLHH